MGPESVGIPYDILEMRRKKYLKEQQINFFKKIHRKKKFKKWNRRIKEWKI